MPGFQITCMNKNAHGALTRIGGNGWSMGIRDAMMQIASQQVRLYVDDDGREVQVGVRGDGTEAYLTLEPDGIPLHEIISLPSC